jgi:tRNA (guanine-N(7)-)-methyltransferase subunit TRM82
MSKLRVPYQCLQKSRNLLVAARGSSIDLFSLEDHSLLSTWKCPTAHESSAKEAGELTTQKPPPKDSDAPALPVPDVSPPPPPAKRRKLSDGGDPQKPLNEGKAKKKSNNRSESVASGLDAPAIITLTVTRAGHHVIATTGDDKTIRVFEIVAKEDGKHHLKSVSQRSVKNHSP